MDQVARRRRGVYCMHGGRGGPRTRLHALLPSAEGSRGLPHVPVPSFGRRQLRRRYSLLPQVHVRVRYLVLRANPSASNCCKKSRTGHARVACSMRTDDGTTPVVMCFVGVAGSSHLAAFAPAASSGGVRGENRKRTSHLYYTPGGWIFRYC
jgi:hypothetical protein